LVAGIAEQENKAAQPPETPAGIVDWAWESAPDQCGFGGVDLKDVDLKEWVKGVCGLSFEKNRDQTRNGISRWR
jgi:hypothetical protein